MGNNTARQLLIGLDAMEWNLVERWAAEGKLPTFQRLLNEGLHGELKTTSAQLPDTVWASICTGTNPGKIEKYFYAQYDPSTGNLKNTPDPRVMFYSFNLVRDFRYIFFSSKVFSLLAKILRQKAVGQQPKNKTTKSQNIVFQGHVCFQDL